MMKLFFLAAVLFVLSLPTCCYAADEPGPVLPIDVARQHDIICDTRRPNHTYGAKRTPVREGYEYLWRRGGYLTLKAKETSRISCSNGAGIFVINETEEDKKSISFVLIADMAREIALTCYDLTSKINGELKDKNEGFVVLISTADC